MKEIEEIQSLVNLIRSVGDIDKEDFDRIINATKSIEPIIKQLESENEKAYGIINNYLGLIIEGNEHVDKLYGLINKLRAENESLKCCENCRFNCELGRKYFPESDCRNLDQWQPKENN